MSNFNFELKPAKKQAIPALIGLWGKSGSGKTYSALLLARGLVGAKGKIAVIDTENQRAKFYSDVAGGWMHLDLQPPFSPDKYSAAFKFCEESGANAIIVDSMSHVWEGEGGVLDIAEEGRTSSGKHLKALAKWKAPKIEHKRMMNNLIRSAIPVIFCLRAKDAVKQVGGGDDLKIVPLGWQPIADKNFIFEMTLDLHMTKDGRYDLETSKTVPAALRGVITKDGVISEAMGVKIAEWCGSGETTTEPAASLPVPPSAELLDAAQENASRGVAAYTAWLATLNADEKASIKPHHKTLSATAKAADEPQI